MAQLLRGFSIEASPAISTRVAGPSAQGFMDRVVAWIAERRLRAQTMNELRRLDQRALHDLSISPTDFPAIARGTWSR
jgi:uncharacterized protein YjiS (DUF1127 family)